MQIGEAFPSKYLKASDFEEPKLLTMLKVKMEPVANDEHKPVLFFRETSKGMVLNKTNARTVVRLYGGDTDAWVEKQIVAFNTSVEFRGDMVEAIRLRAPKKNAGRAESENPALEDDMPF